MIIKQPKKAKKVLIQAPEGIKGIVSRFIPELIEETGANILIHGEACYGGCDLGLVDAERMNIDLVLHVGHTPYFTNKDDPKLVFIEAKDDQEFQNSTLQEILKISKGKTMGLLSSAQYLHHLPKMQDFLKLHLLIDLSFASGTIVAVAVAALTSSLGYPSRPRPLRLAPHGPLGNLLPFYLADESACGKNESSDGGIFELFSDELELSASLFHLVEQNTNMVLVPGEPVHGVGHHNVHRALSEKHP